MHPDWLVGGAVAAERHWGQEIRVLDVTHPQAAEHLVGVYAALRDRGFTFHKIDFVYGGAMAGRRFEDVTPIEAYRRGLSLVREGVGEDAVVLGCGAPLLPSIGLVDAMRISPDVMPHWAPDLGDLSQPGMQSALAAGGPGPGCTAGCGSTIPTACWCVRRSSDRDPGMTTSVPCAASRSAATRCRNSTPATSNGPVG